MQLVAVAKNTGNFTKFRILIILYNKFTHVSLIKHNFSQGIYIFLKLGDFIKYNFYCFWKILNQFGKILSYLAVAYIFILLMTPYACFYQNIENDLLYYLQMFTKIMTNDNFRGRIAFRFYSKQAAWKLKPHRGCSTRLPSS